MPTKISSVDGNCQWLDGGAMFGNAPRPVWEKWLPPDKLGRIPLACRALLIETDNQRILCETGIGAFFEPKMAERFGVENSNSHMLLENLNRLGLKDSDIDIVILSHLHFDHAGGLLPTFEQISAGNKNLLFSKARYVVGREAWQRAINPHSRDRASFIPGMTEQLESSGRLLIVEKDKDSLLPKNLNFFISHGHTPGQMLTVCKGDQSTVIFAGDLIPGLPWVHLPITMGYDRYPELLIDEKAKLYETAVPENWWVFYTHDPNQVASKIRQDEKGRFQPYEAQKDLVRFLV
jgi:glyoxylase-like metal-dependent hydrolase (beta-lactamase superfamily II)